ncbi:MAG: polysaccharide pyruvyl transferase family protein [Candidatus Treponema excrementipullorum]|nr:polysaccharide pyruvyl transferase family protein [Candidatus Treponema excrementipullorum]
MRNLSDIEGIRIFNVPDIVCFLNRSEQSGKRNGILFCMRNDIEKTSCNEDIERLKQYLKEYNYTITSTDTLTGYSIKKKNRRLEVDKKLQLFKTKEIVITDRLHGMLFCLITGTPCIALNNVSKKIEGVWKLWLQEYDYIKYYESLKNIDINIVKSMILKTNIVYNPDSFSIYWNMIKEELK